MELSEFDKFTNETGVENITLEQLRNCARFVASGHNEGIVNRVFKMHWVIRDELSFRENASQRKADFETQERRHHDMLNLSGGQLQQARISFSSGRNFNCVMAAIALLSVLASWASFLYQRAEFHGLKHDGRTNPPPLVGPADTPESHASAMPTRQAPQTQKAPSSIAAPVPTPEPPTAAPLSLKPPEPTLLKK